MGQSNSRSNYCSEEDLKECLIPKEVNEENKHFCIEIHGLQEEPNLSSKEEEPQPEISTIEVSTPSICSMEKLALLLYIAVLALYYFL